MAAEKEVKLLGFSVSPYVARARIALNLKGIEYEFLVEEAGKKSQLLLDSNPIYKKVPVLIHGGKPLCESLIIVQYIDEVWAASGPPILPPDPFDRAIARFWAAFIDEKIPSQMYVLIDNAEESAKEVIVNFFSLLEQLEEVFKKCSEGKSFFGGDTINYIDITLGCYLVWLEALEKIVGIKFLDEDRIPCLVQWAKCFCSSGAVKAVIPEADQLVEFSKLLRLFRQGTATPSN